MAKSSSKPRFPAIKRAYGGRFDSVSAAVLVVVPPTGQIASVNVEAEELTGYEKNELEGMLLADIFRAEDRDRIAALFASSAELEFRKLFEHNVIVRKRSKRKILVDMGFRRATVGRQAVLIFTLQDITELKRNEERLMMQQMVIVQASKMSSLGEMASSIAHEINNPLQVIIGRCELLENMIANPGRGDPRSNAEPRSDAELRSNVALIDKMSQRIDRIIRGLHSLSRDQRNDEMELADLRGVVSDTLALCEQRIRSRIGSFTVSGLEEPVYLRCRPTQISQVLLNLLNNSFDAVVSSAKSWMRLDVRAAADKIQIAVTDSGPGVPDEVAQKVFLPFFTTKPVGQGTGIGLSISRTLVEAHGGKLTLDARAANTCFVITLPRAEAPGASLDIAG